MVFCLSSGSGYGVWVIVVLVLVLDGLLLMVCDL